MDKPTEFQALRQNLKEIMGNVFGNRTPIALLCDRMEDAQNVGSMFRIGDAARLEKIYFYQPSVEVGHPKVTKVARSTDKYVPFEVVDDFSRVEALRQDYEVVALEKTAKSVEYSGFEPQQPLKILLIVGSEKQGISAELLALASATIHLPMLGVNTSMNVSVATGIAVYDLLSKRR